MFDFTSPICDIKGKPIIINEETGETKPLADLIAEALLADDPDTKATGADKLRRHGLAQRLAMADAPLELTAKEQTVINEQSGKYLNPLAYGQVAAVLGVTAKGEE